MYFLREVQKDVTRLSDLLLWGGLVHGPTPAVMQNKDGMLMATLRYRAPDVGTMAREQRAHYLAALNSLLMRLGTGWALFADEWHEPTTEYPVSTWSHPTACFVDAARRALFESGVLHESQQFLTLCWQPPTATAQRWYEHWFTTQAHTTQMTDDHANLESFVQALEQWSDGLAGLFPAWGWCTPEETLTYLHRCISWDRHTVGTPDVPMYLDGLLSSADFLPGHTPALGGVLLRPICVKTWPKELGAAVPTALQGLTFPYRFTVRYLALDKAEALAVLNDYQDKWGQQLWSVWQYVGSLVSHTPLDPDDPKARVNEVVKAHGDSLDRARQSLQADAVRYGYLTPTITVWGATAEELAAREREVVKLLQQHEMVVVPERVNAPQAWLGTLPGDVYHNVRKPCLPSLALAFLLPHATIWAGPAEDTHLQGPPLLVASSEGVPFRLVLHPGASELGNTMVLGPSRSGKSALLGVMMSQFLRYQDAQIFCFDKDFALYAATLLGGGVHYDLGNQDTLGLQPFGRLDDGEAEHRWAHQWVQALIMSQGEHLSPQDREQLWVALGRLATMPAPLRTLSAYVELLQVQRLKPAFMPFLRGGRMASSMPIMTRLPSATGRPLRCDGSSSCPLSCRMSCAIGFTAWPNGLMVARRCWYSTKRASCWRTRPLGRKFWTS